MSRSRKKNFYSGFCNDSDKPGKKKANRKFRRHINSRIAQNIFEFENIRALSNALDMPKDGKFYFGNCEDKEKLQRK